MGRIFDPITTRASFLPRQVLLVSDILIGGNHHVESRVLRYPQQLTGTFLSNTMRNAVALGVRQDGFYAVRRNLKLLGNFGGAQAVVEVIDHSVRRHARAAKHRGAAQDSRLNLDQRAVRPVNFLLRSHR
jgi:hypothetical protein